MIQTVKKLVFVSPEFPPGPGGIGTHAFQICRELTRLNYTILVLAPWGSVSQKEASAFDRGNSFQVVRLPESQNRVLQFIFRIIFVLNRIRKFKPELIISSSYTSGVFSLLPQYWLNIPRVSIGHGAEFGLNNFIASAISKFVFKKTIFSIAVSNFTKSAMSDVGLPESRIFVIPNGADPQRFHSNYNTAEIIQKHNLQGKTVLLTVGRMCERKGQDIVIRALAEVKGSFPDLVYLIAGHPEEQSGLKLLSDSLGLSDSVLFFPNVPYDTLPLFYSLADLYILNSRKSQTGDFEGFGISIMEAAFAGIPSIGSSGFGIDDAIEEGITGLLIQPDSVAATSGAIHFLLKNKDQRLKMGRAACSRAEAEFSWEKIALRYKDKIDLIGNDII